MEDERDPNDTLPEDPPKPPKKRKPRKKKAVAPYTIKYRGKKYIADIYAVNEGLFSFTLGTKTTFLPVNGPIEVERSKTAAVFPDLGMNSFIVPAPVVPKQNLEADRFAKERNSRLASLSGFGSEFGAE